MASVEILIQILERRRRLDMKKWILPLALILLIGISFDSEARRGKGAKKAEAEVSDVAETTESGEASEESGATEASPEVSKTSKKLEATKASKSDKEKTNVTPDGSVTVEEVSEKASEDSEDVVKEAMGQQRHTKWEYLAVDLKSPEKDKYRRKWDILGRDGWELAGSSMKAGDTDVYIFKRPVLDD